MTAKIKIKLCYEKLNYIISFLQIHCFRSKKVDFDIDIVMASAFISVPNITRSIIVKRARDWNNERLQKSLTDFTA